MELYQRLIEDLAHISLHLQILYIQVNAKEFDIPWFEVQVAKDYEMKPNGSQVNFLCLKKGQNILAIARQRMGEKNCQQIYVYDKSSAVAQLLLAPSVKCEISS